MRGHERFDIAHRIVRSVERASFASGLQVMKTEHNIKLGYLHGPFNTEADFRNMAAALDELYKAFNYTWA